MINDGKSMFNVLFKQIRKECNFSAREIAEKLNVSINLIYEWEHNRCEPSISTLTKIADIFGVTTDYLLGREDDFGNIVIPEQKSGNKLSSKEIRLLSAFSYLDEEEKNKLIDDAEFFARRATKNVDNK